MYLRLNIGPLKTSSFVFVKLLTFSLIFSNDILILHSRQDEMINKKLSQ
jgi:hypothetical protein